MNIAKLVSEGADIGLEGARKRIAKAKAAMGISGRTNDMDNKTQQEIANRAISNDYKPKGMATDQMKSVSIDSSFDEIKIVGMLHQRKTAEHLIAFCKCVAVLHTKCAPVSGGSEFSTKVMEFWGLDESNARKLLKVGKTDYFGKFTEALPASNSSLIALTKLPEEKFEDFVKSGKINPAMTAKDVKALISQEGEATKQATGSATLIASESDNDDEEDGEILEEKQAPTKPKSKSEPPVDKDAKEVSPKVLTAATDRAVVAIDACLDKLVNEIEVLGVEELASITIERFKSKDIELNHGSVS